MSTHRPRSIVVALLATALGPAARRGPVPATGVGRGMDRRARRTARRCAHTNDDPGAAREMAAYRQAVIEIDGRQHRGLGGAAARGRHVRRRGVAAPVDAVLPRLSFPGQVVPQR